MGSLCLKVFRHFPVSISHSEGEKERGERREREGWKGYSGVLFSITKAKTH